MMKALAGSKAKVTGSSRATVMAGPSPGSTPTAVPSSTPSSAESRFIGVAAVLKPSSSEDHTSMSEHPFQYAGRQQDAQAEIEPVERDERKQDRDPRAPSQVPAAQRPGAAPEKERPGDQPAQPVDEHDVGDERRDQRQDAPPLGGRAEAKFSP